ncbi:MAG: hypothetical protein SO442_07325 [Prevotella sp.]|nr:hypothetical protein [Prevotella sp.]MDY5258319.1 hypothetical protein [Prevotella sp.]
MKKKKIYIRPAIQIIRTVGEKHFMVTSDGSDRDHVDTKPDYFTQEEEEDDGWNYKKYNIWEDQ